MQRRDPNAVRRPLSYPLSRGGTTAKWRSHAKKQRRKEDWGWESNRWAHAKKQRRKEDRDGMGWDGMEWESKPRRSPVGSAVVGFNGAKLLVVARDLTVDYKKTG